MSDSEVRTSIKLGDTLQWDGAVADTLAYVELPFWLMLNPCTVPVTVDGIDVPIDICGPMFEVFLGEVTDSRDTCVHMGPVTREPWQALADLTEMAADQSLDMIRRPCKTVLRVRGRALVDAFVQLGELDDGWARASVEAYWASFCEGYLPAINELIQRYRLLSYDYFAYDVSAWDVPAWHIRQGAEHIHSVLVPAKRWDRRPVVVQAVPEPGQEAVVEEFVFTDGEALTAAAAADATPGEFDLLDARSLMERGDYSGAVRRATTAIEAVVEWSLGRELGRLYDPSEVEDRLRKSQNDFPGRFRQLQKLFEGRLPETLIAEFDRTREVRHEIVHEAKRLTHADRHVAQRMVDTGRWLFNQIEASPERTRLRDFGVLRSFGRTALAPRFPTRLTPEGVCVDPLPSHETDPH